MSKQLLKGFNGKGLYAERAESDHLGRPFTETYLTHLDKTQVIVTATKSGGVYSLDKSFNTLKELLDSRPAVLPILRVVDLSTNISTVHEMKSYNGSVITFGSPIQVQATMDNFINGTTEVEYSYGTADTFARTERTLSNAVYAVETINL